MRRSLTLAMATIFIAKPTRRTGGTVSDLPNVSPGEVGGIFAGTVAVLAALGKGIQWLFNWNDTRVASRSEKLQQWHDELTTREDRLEALQNELHAKIEQRLNAAERENRAFRQAFDLVVSALRQQDPQNPALIEAQNVLDLAFDHNL